MKNVLITGISGGLAQITAGILQQSHPKLKILGVDMRNVHQIKTNENFKVQKIRYSRSQFEKIFRDNQFDIVYHLGRLSHSGFTSNLSIEERLDIGVTGTNQILDLCLRTKVKKVVVLSTFHVYGARADNPAYIDEDTPPKATLKYPELRDVVEMDQIATNWMWRHQNDVSTIVFRPSNIIGPRINNTFSKYLSHHYSPRPADFDPMFQFVHEYDMSHVLAYCLDHIPTGLYNVSTNQVIALSQALKIAGSRGPGIPFTLVKTLARMLKTPFVKAPDYLIDYLMYPCLIENKNLMKHLPENFFRFSIEEALRTLQLK